MLCVYFRLLYCFVCMVYCLKFNEKGLCLKVLMYVKDIYQLTNIHGVQGDLCHQYLMQWEISMANVISKARSHILPCPLSKSQTVKLTAALCSEDVWYIYKKKKEICFPLLRLKRAWKALSLIKNLYIIQLLQYEPKLTVLLGQFYTELVK